MSQALYRRYRPETFEDVIGQEHVTAPLMQALRSGRVNHAYLFSGPRGCGKTTSARILARCLNCAGADGAAVGPTDVPCGVCPSCVELARGGSGSLDVVEIDAASHGGVDDARELRERATFAPARDRFKVFVIDEAHMVTTQGFNALLKIVEEPPPHIKFVFATTEPDKVIGTIRSRTHHYPFHLVPPERLHSYLEQMCASEGVRVGKGVLSLVVRAGAGSVRDSLSVLDQLMAGAEADGLDYEHAIALLGYTHASLLDDVIDAFAAGDGATVFRVVDKVIGSGHDPRRFVEDLLERLRDLIIVQALQDAAGSVLRGLPDDQMARMRGQAARFGAAQLSRAADVANDALTEMVGATSPRLHLELLCARVLLPGSEVGERGLGARLDRLERRLGVPAESSAVPLPVPVEPSAVPLRVAVKPTAEAAAPSEPAVSSSAGTARPPTDQAPEQAAPQPAAGREPDAAPAAVASDAPEPADIETVRRQWPDVLTRLAGLKRGTWSLVSQNAQVLDFADSTLRLAFSTQGLATTFAMRAHEEFVRQALFDAIGLDARVVAVVMGSEPDPTSPPPVAAPDDGWNVVAPGGQGQEQPEAAAPVAEPEVPRAEQRPPAREEQPPPDVRPPPSVAPENDQPSHDDPDAEDSGLVGTEVVERMLGGRVIDADPPGR